MPEKNYFCRKSQINNINWRGFHISRVEKYEQYKQRKFIGKNNKNACISYSCRDLRKFVKKSTMNSRETVPLNAFSLAVVGWRTLNPCNVYWPLQLLLQAKQEMLQWGPHNKIATYRLERIRNSCLRLYIRNLLYICSIMYI
jgi:hypothetical protein